MIALAVLMLAWLIVGCVLMVIDVTDLCDEMTDEALRDALWDDEAAA